MTNHAQKPSEGQPGRETPVSLETLSHSQAYEQWKQEFEGLRDSVVNRDEDVEAAGRRLSGFYERFFSVGPDDLVGESVAFEDIRQVIVEGEHVYTLREQADKEKELEELMIDYRRGLSRDGEEISTERKKRMNEEITSSTRGKIISTAGEIAILTEKVRRHNERTDKSERDLRSFTIEEQRQVANPAMQAYREKLSDIETP